MGVLGGWTFSYGRGTRVRGRATPEARVLLVFLEPLARVLALPLEPLVLVVRRPRPAGGCIVRHDHYRGTSLIRKRTPLGPYRRRGPRVVAGC